MALEQHLRRQQILFQETGKYLARDFPKYFPGAFGLWFFVFKFDYQRGDPYRSTYYFFRHVDDVLDGDRSVTQDPTQYVKDIRSSIETNHYDVKRQPILILAKRALSHLENVKKNGDQPKKEVIQLINAMLHDRQRMQDKEVLSEESLHKEYQRQFHPIINLQFICLESDLRVKDIPDFPILQPRIYSVVDMKKDWQKGLINIPAEVLQQAGLSPDSAFEQVRQSPIVQAWIYKECLECRQQLDQVDKVLSEKLVGPNEKFTRIMFHGLAFGIRKSINKILSHYDGS